MKKPSLRQGAPQVAVFTILTRFEVSKAHIAHADKVSPSVITIPGSTFA